MKKVQAKLFGGKRRYHPPQDVSGEGKQFGDSSTDHFLDQFLEVDNALLNEDQLELISLLREGFASLSDMQKRVILLMVDQNLSERAAAEVLGIHYGTLLNHLTRARKKLKKYVMQNADLGIISERYITEMLQNEATEEDTSDYPDTDESD